ncbi:MAG: precorrin-2 C(20)-methyltransferase [Lachnospiraceae bacterium]|nr:precorrin-2 C(20)-methyltransferase [Lachnospiraceae bacterium]
MGIFYGVGVGPGDPENITLKALRIIKECPVIVLPNGNKEDCYAYKIVKQVYPGIDDKEILCCEFPMISGVSFLRNAHDKVYEQVVPYLEKADVAFLTIGDPTIYSTYAYISERVAASGGSVKLINGVPSFCAVAARLGIPLAVNKQEIHIIPGSARLEDTAGYEGTCVYMKSGKKLKELTAFLKGLSTQRNMRICGVSNCGMENEVVYSDLEELSNSPDNEYLTIVISLPIRP